jgi:hypothetical protein
MIFKEISLEEIDFNNETFRISEELDPALVLDSLREIGQLNPVILLNGNPLKVIVCGFRRIRAMRQLGSPRILARILSCESCNQLRIFELALWDNLSHRQLNLLEKARVLLKLQSVCGVSNDRLVRVYMPILGLMPRESLLQSFVLLNSAQPGLRRSLAEDRLTFASIEILVKTPYPVQNSLSALMTNVRLSASLQKKVLSLLEDLAAITDTELDAPLQSPEVLTILDDSRLSPFQKGEKLHEVLYRLRNPGLSLALERFLAQKKLLGLPGSIRITPHPFFETTDLRVEFQASNIERFREMAAALNNAGRLPELEEMFRIT